MKYLLIVLLIMGLLTVHSFTPSEAAKGVSYSTYTKNQNEFDVYGMVDKIIENVPVILNVTNTDGKTIFSSETMPDEDGIFNFVVSKNEPLWNNVTDYSLVVNYGTISVNDADSEYDGRLPGNSEGIFKTVIEIPKTLSLQKNSVLNFQMLDESQVTINQGQNGEIWGNLLVNGTYGISSLHLTVDGLPSGITAKVIPNGDQFNEWFSPAQILIPIAVEPDTMLGYHSFRLLASGVLEGQNLEDKITITNQTIAVLTINVGENKNPVSLSIGIPDAPISQFCTNEQSGNSCMSFVNHEEFPLKIYSKNKDKIVLSVQGQSEGIWAKIIPQTIIADQNGSNVKLLLAGAVKPFTGPPFTPDTQHLVINAKTQTGVATIGVPVVESVKIITLKEAGPIKLLDEIPGNNNMQNFNVYGVVYDPDDTSKTQITVSLSVLGLSNGNTINPFPSWFSINIPNPTFSLNANEPYYFMIKENQGVAPQTGTYFVAIKEIIDGKEFIENVPITVFEPMQLSTPSIRLEDASSYSINDLEKEIVSYSQFLDFCKRYDPALWDSMSSEKRIASILCDFRDKGFDEKEWNWLNGTKLDWKNFAQKKAEEYAMSISSYREHGLKDSLVVKVNVSGIETFPPPLNGIISFNYTSNYGIQQYKKEFMIGISGLSERIDNKLLSHTTENFIGNDLYPPSISWDESVVLGVVLVGISISITIVILKSKSHHKQ